MVDICETNLKFRAVALVMKYGAENDRKNPFEKAREILNFVTVREQSDDLVPKGRGWTKKKES